MTALTSSAPRRPAGGGSSPPAAHRGPPARRARASRPATTAHSASVMSEGYLGRLRGLFPAFPNRWARQSHSRTTELEPTGARVYNCDNRASWRAQGIDNPELHQRPCLHAQHAARPPDRVPTVEPTSVMIGTTTAPQRRPRGHPPGQLPAVRLGWRSTGRMTATGQR